MTEQELYKNILSRIIDRTEQFHFSSSKELVQHLIEELHDNHLPSKGKYLN